jgi:hypothetical protein
MVMTVLQLELERFKKFCIATELKPSDGIEECGHGADYYTSEMFTIDSIDGLIFWILNGYCPESPETKIAPYIDVKIKLAEILEHKATRYKNLYVCEVGRGLEILLAMFFNCNFESIVCYDHNPVYGALIKQFFKDDKIKFFRASSQLSESEQDGRCDNLLPPKPLPDTLLIWDHGNRLSVASKYLNDSNVCLAILNGVCVKDSKNDI